MDKSIRGITLEIGGDTTRLGQALQQTEKDISNVGKELSAIERGLKFEPGNMELLGQKAELSAKQIEQTSQKLEELKAAQEQVNAQAERGEITVEQQRAFRREIIATESRLRGLEQSLEGTNFQLANGGKTAEQMARELAETERQASELGDSTKDAGGKVSVFGDALKASLAADAIKAGLSGLVDAIAGIGSAVVDAGKAMINSSVAGAQYADDILTLSAQTGIATDSLEAYAYAAELVDVSMETMTGSMAKNIKSMTNATDETKGVGKAYADLGINVRDANGHLRDSETVYWEAIDALGAVADETDRDSLAMQIFGKSAQDLNPLIQQGSAGIAEFTEEARAMGVVMGGDALEAFGDFDDNIQRLKGGFTGLSNSVGRLLLPSLTELSGVGVDLLGNFTSALNEAGGDPEKIAAAINDGLQSVIETINTQLPLLIEQASNMLGPIVEGIVANLPMLAEAVVPIIDTITGVIVDGLPVILEVGFTILTTLVDGIMEQLPRIIDIGTQIILKLVNKLIEMLPEIIETGIAIIVQLVQGIAAALPELIPAIVNAVILMAETLIDNIDLLIDAAIELMIGLADGLMEALPLLTEKVPEIVEKLFVAFVENAPKLIDAGAELVFNVGKGMLNTVGSTVDNFFSAINEAFLSESYKIYRAEQEALDPDEQTRNAIAMQAYMLGGDYVKDMVRGLTYGEILENALAAQAERAVAVENMRQSFEDAQEAGKNLVEKIKSGIDEARGIEKSIQLKLENPLSQENIVGALSKAYDVGTSIAKNIENGIKGIPFEALIESTRKFEATMLGQIKREQSEINRITIQNHGVLTEEEKKYQKERFDEVVKWADNAKFFNELSAEDEIKLWAEVAEKYAGNADLKLQAEKNLYSAQQKLDKDRKDLQAKSTDTAKKEAEKLAKDIEKVRSDLLKELENQTTAYGEAITEALKRSKREEINIRKEAIQDQIDLLGDVKYKEITASEDITERKIQLIDDEFIAKTKNIDEGLAAFLTASNQEIQKHIDIIALTDQEGAARLQAIKDRTDALDAASQKEKDAIEARNVEERTAELNKRISEAETWEAREKAFNELQKYEEDLAYKAREKKRADEKKALQEESKELLEATKKTAEEQAKIIAEIQKEQQKEIKSTSEDLKDGKYDEDSERQSLASLEEQYKNFEKTAEGLALKLVEAGEAGQQEALKVLEEYYPDWQDKGKKFVDKLSQGYRDNMKTATDDAMKIGAESAKGVAKGLDDNAYLVQQASSRLAAIIQSTLANDLDIQSPSKVLRSDGQFAGLGLALGLEDMIPVVERAARKLGIASRPSANETGGYASGGQSAAASETNITINNNVTGVVAPQLLYQLDRANKKAARRIIGTASPLFV